MDFWNTEAYAYMRFATSSRPSSFTLINIKELACPTEAFNAARLSTRDNVLPLPHLKVCIPSSLHLIQPTTQPKAIHPLDQMNIHSDASSSKTELSIQSSPSLSAAPPLLSGSTAKRRRRARASSSPRRAWVAGLGWLGGLFAERWRGRRRVRVLVLGSESLLLMLKDIWC